ncbi:MAG: hypothetical protein EOP51_11690, partial [Sphingobacteriales bacterium]
PGAFSQTDSLKGKLVTVYSKGYKERAQTIHQLLTGAIVFYEKIYPSYPYALQLRVLDSTDWNKLPYSMPYGMPHSRNGIVVAANKNAMFNDTTAATDISGYDAIALHELGHYFIGDLVKTDIWPNWANEFIASYYQVCYTKASGIRYPAIETKFVATHRSLEDFEKGFQFIGGGDSYGWYQEQFMKLANMLYPKHKLAVLNAFIENYKPGGKQQEAMTLLKKIDPEIMDSWLAEMK